MTVIAIIAILAAILFPVFARSREQARKTSCMMNLTNIALALRAYAGDHDGWYPPTEDDLSPLLPEYVDTEKVFMCPSNSSQDVLMGEPANPRPAPEQMGPEGEGGMMGVPPPGPPPELPPPGPPPGPPGAEGRATPQPGPEAGVPVPAQESDMPPVPPGAVFTSFYYRAGRMHNQTPLAPLCSDHESVHNGRANVLFSDGAVKSLPEGPWREWGFVPIDEILASRQSGQQIPPGFY